MAKSNNEPRFFGRHAVKYGTDINGRTICWFRYHGFYVLPPYVTVDIFNHTSVKFCYSCRNGRRFSMLAFADRPGDVLRVLTETIKTVFDDGYLFSIKVRRNWIDDPQGRINETGITPIGYVPIPIALRPYHPSKEKNIRVGRVNPEMTYSELCKAIEKEAYCLRDWFINTFSMTVDEALTFINKDAYPAELIKERFALADRRPQFNLQNLGTDEHGNKLMRLGGMGIFVIPTYAVICKTGQDVITTRYVDRFNNAYSRSVKIKKHTGGCVIECMRAIYEVMQEDGCLFSRPIKRDWLIKPSVTVRKRQHSNGRMTVSIPIPAALRTGEFEGKKEWYRGSAKEGSDELTVLQHAAQQEANRLRDLFIDRYEITVEEALIRISG